MEELVPFILGVILGAPIAFKATNRARTAIAATLMLLIGAAATLLSGEYQQSWAYLLLDCGEAALGCALGLVLAARLSTRHAPIRAARPGRNTL